MPSSKKQRRPWKRPAAPQNKNNIFVFISGFRGLHPIEVGIAYFYRGHHLYSPGLDPVKPEQFTTRDVVLLRGMPRKSVPRYEPFDPDLQEESEVCALHGSKVYEWGRMTTVVRSGEEKVGAPKSEEVNDTQGKMQCQGILLFAADTSRYNGFGIPPGSITEIARAGV